jgi:hypothetical protein
MITTAVMAMTSKTLTTMAAISAAVSLETLTSSNVWAEKKCINLFILSARDLLMLKKKGTFWSSHALSTDFNRYFAFVFWMSGSSLKYSDLLICITYSGSILTFKTV